MSESELKRIIVDYLREIPHTLTRVIQVHGLRGRKSPMIGFADVFHINGGTVYGFEVKGPRGKLEASQKELQAEWNRAGGVYVVVHSVIDVKRCLGAL